MNIKDRLRHFLKFLLKAFKGNPELFIGFVLGFLIVVFGAFYFLNRSLNQFENQAISDLASQVDLIEEQVIYTVQAGDSSWKLAERFYGCGEAYPEIEKANGLEVDSYLEIGQGLIIPNIDACNNLGEDQRIKTKDQREVNSSQVDMSASEQVEYQINEGDCLWSIALKQLGNPYRWVEIYELNKDVIGNNPNLIYPGASLKFISNSIN